MSRPTHQILDDLGLKAENPGACFGPGRWSTTTDAGTIDSINPATGEVIARVHAASEADYERVMTQAVVTARAWRQVPAPVRGEAVRRVTEALRDYKDPLGSLVAMEMGKIKPEGDGEVHGLERVAERRPALRLLHDALHEGAPLLVAEGALHLAQ
ncbi:MAG: aldehyde dehydrogenase family protein, partial [Wenzhouxiangellaceae bacterium]